MKKTNNHGHRLRWSRAGNRLIARCQLCDKPAGSGVECAKRLELFEVK